MQPIGSDLRGLGGPLTFRFGQAIVLHAVTVALKPVLTDLPDEPVRCEGGHIIQDCPQGFSHTFRLESERTRASTWVESLRCLPPALSQPRCLHTCRSRSNSRVSAPSCTRRRRNSDNREKSKPGSVSSSPKLYFQSMRSRT